MDGLVFYSSINFLLSVIGENFLAIVIVYSLLPFYLVYAIKKCKEEVLDLKEQVETGMILQKKIKKELFAKKRLLDLTIADAPIGMATVGLEGEWLMVNKALCKMLGYKEAELLAMDFQSITHPEDLDKGLTLIQKFSEGAISQYDIEKRYLHRQGHYIWGWLSVSLLRNEENQPIQFISQIVDISQRKQSELKLKQSEKLFRQSVKYSPIGFSLHDAQFKWVSANNGLCNILGYTEEELLNKNVEDLILPADKEIGYDKMFQMLERKISYARVEKRHLHKDGSIIWMALNTTIIWEANEFKHLLIQWANITPLKNKEAEILKFNEQLESRVKERTLELEEAYRESENFAYVLTHDLRQPLKNMATLPNLLKKEYQEQLDEEGVYILSLMETNANRADTLIVDMLDYMKASRKNFKKSSVDLVKLFREEFEIGKLLYPNIPIFFRVASLPLVLGNEAALRQVCQNLVSNALKYSSKKAEIKIDIQVKVKEEKVIFSIKDNGVGFDEANSSKIFKVFQRLHKSKDFEGTGVGMPISAKIIEKHGGKMWARSKVNEGATFYFTLPLLSGTKSRPKSTKLREMVSL